MSYTVPKTMKALVTQPDRTVKVQEISVPEIDDNEVLVKIVAVAQNPVDWMFLVYPRILAAPNKILGLDWSGRVVKTGRNVTSLSVGDSVAGFDLGATYEDRGAFAEYVKTPWDLTWKIPEDTITHEQAATMGCSFWTAVQVLFHPTRLGLVEPPNKVNSEEWVLVYGGSGSVGMFAIQLAHAAGYKVVTTASPRNHELCKALGADAVFDYKDPDAVNKIKDITHNSLRLGLDAVSELDTQKFSVRTFGSTGGRLIAILEVQKEAQDSRSDVAIQFTNIFTSLGRDFTFGNAPFPAVPEDHKHMTQFLEKVPELVKSGQVMPNPTKLLEGGLEGINAGLKYMMEGNVSGKKIVYRIHA